MTDTNHQRARDFERLLKSNVGKAGSTGKEVVLNMYSHVAHKPTFLLMAVRSLFFIFVIFTFIAGFIFVDLPLIEAANQHLYRNGTVALAEWVQENDKDGQTIMAALLVAAGVAVIWVIVNVFRDSKRVV